MKTIFGKMDSYNSCGKHVCNACGHEFTLKNNYYRHKRHFCKKRNVASNVKSTGQVHMKEQVMAQAGRTNGPCTTCDELQQLIKRKDELMKVCLTDYEALLNMVTRLLDHIQLNHRFN
jgi:hypothetical protein